MHVCLHARVHVLLHAIHLVCICAHVEARGQCQASLFFPFSRVYEVPVCLNGLRVLDTHARVCWHMGRSRYLIILHHSSTLFSEAGPLRALDMPVSLVSLFWDPQPSQPGSDRMAGKPTWNLCGFRGSRFQSLCLSGKGFSH